MVSAEVELLAWPCAASAHVLFLLSKYSVASWRRLADVDGTAGDFREGCVLVGLIRLFFSITDAELFLTSMVSGLGSHEYSVFVLP